MSKDPILGRSSHRRSVSANGGCRNRRRHLLKNRRRKLRCEILETRRVLAATLKIEGPDIDGDSTIAKHEDEIVVGAFTWGLTRVPTSSGTTTSTKAVVDDFHFIKRFDRSTPDLLQDSVIGPFHDKIALSVFSETSDSPSLAIELDNSRLTNFFTSEDDGNDSKIFEDISLSFTGINFKYQEFDGGGIKTSELDWNLIEGDQGSELGNPTFPGPSSTPASGPFLTINGQDVAVDSFDWNAGQNVTLSGGQLQSAGNAEAGEFTFTRPIDLATPRLLHLAAAGTNLGDINLSDQISINGKSVTNIEWTLHDAFISSFAVSGDDVLSNALNEFSISSDKIEVQYTDFDAKGSQSNTTKAVWDLDVGPSSVVGAGNFGDNDLNSQNVNTLIFPGGAELEFDAFAWSATNTFERFGGGGGSPQPGIGQFDALTVSAPLDESTPGLIATLAKGEKAGDFVVKRPQSKSEFVQWDLSDAFVTSYSIIGTSEPQQEPFVEFGISFAKAEVEQKVMIDLQLESATAEWSVITKEGKAPNELGGQDFDDKTDKRDLQIAFVQGSTVSDVEISSVEWKVERKANGTLSIDDFEINANSGIHSPGLFHAVAASSFIDSASIKRHVTIDGNRVELYRWDFADVVLQNYTTSGFGPPGIGAPETFSIDPRTVKLTTFEYDTKGTLQSTSSFDWDVSKNTSTSSNIGSFGNLVTKSTLPLEQQILFDDGSSLALDSFDWGAKLGVGPPTGGGSRSISPAMADDFTFRWFGAPLTSHLRAVVDGKAATSKVDVRSSVLDQQGAKFQPYSNWTLSGNLPFKELQFIDENSQPAPYNQFSLDFDDIELQVDQLANDGSVEGKTSVDWNILSTEVNSTGDFGTATFDPLDLPKSVLKVDSASVAPEFKVVGYVWGTSNPIQQDVGSIFPAKREGGGRSVFELIAEYDQTSPGFIGALAKGALIDELNLTSYEFPDAKTARPFRNWEFTDVFVTGYRVIPGVTGSGQKGFISLNLDIGKVVSTITTYDDKASSPAESLVHLDPTPHGSNADAASNATTFTNSLDYITPPVSKGIPNQKAFDLGTATIALPNFFTDEQEESKALSYSVAGNTNPGLFDSASVDISKNLFLDLADGQQGTATLTIEASDSFGLIASTMMNVDVGLAPDFGDAPAPFPTLLADNGASHQATGPRLGFLRDREPDGAPSALADGDVGDEDGVMFGAVQVGQPMAAVNIDLQNAANAKVDAWVDFNRDGAWDASEKILSTQPVSDAGPGVPQTINFSVPSGTVAGLTYARVRVSSAGGIDPTGNAPDGEVEDYQINILPVAPQVESVEINGGDASRSGVTSLTVQFDTELDHAALSSAFTISNITTGTQVGTVNVNATDSGGKTTAELTFAGASTITPLLGPLSNSLADGNYRLDISSGGVKLAEGNLASMTSDHEFGGQLAAEPNNDNFFRHYGDVDGDGNTDFLDFSNGFLPAFGNGVGDPDYREDLDFNGDGNVDFIDFADGFLPAFGTGRP